MTADELLRMPKDSYRYELVQGELRKMFLAGEEHGSITAEIATELATYVFDRKLGRVYGPNTGFLLHNDPDTVRAPDVSFVRAERVVRTPKYYPGAPDLAMEVISPDDTYSEVEEKKDEYLRAGVQAVVIVDPRRKSVVVHRKTGATNLASALAVDDVVPGWQLPLADLFA